MRVNCAMYKEIKFEKAQFRNNGANLPYARVCFIIPSHYFEHKIKDGSAEQRDRAIYTLKITQLIRGQRMALAGLRGLAASGHQEMRREIYDMQNSQTQTELPGKLVRQESGDETGDLDGDNVYNNTGSVYEFYKKIFNRNSLDNHGMPMVSSVHFARDFDNAFWNGRQMVYGDGDDVDFKKHKLAELLDVTGHEMTHGVTNHTSNLDYVGESGGLNESMSDCFGIMISQWVSNQTVDAAHWLIGEGLMTDGKALRSMKDPGTANQYDDQIKNYRDYRPDMDVHTSSGIANYAFYLACKNVGGNSWEKIGKVWYITNTARLRHNSGFQDAGNHTFDVAGSLFGEGSPEQNAIYNAWHDAGIDAEKPDLVANSGGIAGLSKKINLDTSSLPSSEVQQVQSMVDNSNFYELPNKTGQPDPNAADYLKYKITLESEDGRKHTVETTDVTMPAALSPFVGYLRKKIKEQRR